MDVYMPSMPSSAMNIPTSRVTHPQQQILSPDEEMQRQLEEFKRSVTIIIWYKANSDPIRLQQYLPAFPYFQLSSFNNLIEDLGLSHGSYLDTYIPGSNQWEQHTITSIRMVESQQRLIYKVRRTLIEPLSEEECPSLRDELQLQPRMRGAHSTSTATGQSSSLNSPSTPSVPDSKVTSTDGQPKNMLKRSAPQNDQEPRHSPKVHVTNGYYMSNSGSSSLVSSPVAGAPTSTTSTPTLPSPQSSTHQQDNNVYMYQNPVFYGGGSGQGHPDNNSLPHYLLSPQTSAAPIPYHPHPPLKRWPNDYTVSELSTGFHSMDLLISQSPTGASMTQRTAFERVFGSRYVKSTVCRHRAVWRKAPRALREQFESMGTDDRACWGEFVRRVENRPSGKNANANVELMSPQQSNNMGYHDQQSSAEEDDVHTQESVMGSMQNQVSSSSSSNSIGNSMNVYDSRNHLANAVHSG